MKERRLDGAKTSGKRVWFLRGADSGGNPVPTRQIRPSSNSSSQYNPISVLRVPVKTADNDNFVRAVGVAGGVGLDCCVTTSIGAVAVVVFFTHKPQGEGRGRGRQRLA